MLATILKRERTTAVTFAIIETFAMVRGLKRELVELHKETDNNIQTQKMHHFGEVLTDIVMPDLETSETESSLEINFLIGKIKHTVKRIRKDDKICCFFSQRMRKRRERGKERSEEARKGWGRRSRP